MAAGLGFKTFTSGEVLTAADTNGYLMQGILVFASASARNAAITSPQEGQYSYLKDTNALEYYDGAAWVGAPVGDITSVTAGTGISGGGTSGAVTITNSMATEIDAKGDLIAGTGADTFARVAVGSNFAFLQANSTPATGVAWNNDAWTSYTPTIAANSGSFTTASATGFYTRIGKLCSVRISIVITTNGTAAGTVTATLPFTTAATDAQVGTHRENQSTGTMGSIVVAAGSSTSVWRTYNNLYPGGTGTTLVGQITYEVA